MAGSVEEKQARPQFQWTTSLFPPGETAAPGAALETARRAPRWLPSLTGLNRGAAAQSPRRPGWQECTQATLLPRITHLSISGRNTSMET